MGTSTVVCLFPHTHFVVELKAKYPAFLAGGILQPLERQQTPVTMLNLRGGDGQIAWDVCFTAVLFVQLPVFTSGSILFWKMLRYHTLVFANTTFNHFVFFQPLLVQSLLCHASTFGANNQSCSYANTYTCCRGRQRCMPSLCLFSVGL